MIFVQNLNKSNKSCDWNLPRTKEEILNFDYSLPPYPHIYPDISEMNRVYPRNSELQNISETDLGLCFYMFLTEQNM